MIASVVRWSSGRPWLVIALAAILGVASAVAARSLRRDVLPDLAAPRATVMVDWMGHSAEEVARAVTAKLTAALAKAAPRAEVRGSSMTGMAYVEVVFPDHAALEGARRALGDALSAMKPELPSTARVQVEPDAASTGWVLQYAVTDPAHHHSLLELRQIAEAQIAPALRGVPGVRDVATAGGARVQVSVDARLDELAARNVAYGTLTDTLEAALRQRQAAGAGAGAGLDALGDVVVGEAVGGHPPTRIRDVAYVRKSDEMPPGLVDLGGRLRAVGGVVIAERDADPARVAGEARDALVRVAPSLPEGVQAVVVYDRSEVVDRVERTLVRSLGEEIVVVVLVVLLFLLHGRSALVPLLTLPLTLLLSFGAMWALRLPATLMSVGGIGIALGIAVDADVVALEACHRRLEALGADPSEPARRRALLLAAGSFTPAILTSLVITALSFLPVFAFTGETGRLLQPLAITKTVVIASAALVTITLAPALRDRLLRGNVRRESDHALLRVLLHAYRPFVHFALRRPLLTLLTAGLAVLSAVPLVPKLGGEFLPRIDEGDLLSMPSTRPGVMPEQALMQLQWQDRTLGAAGEVATAFGKVGRAETATDPAPFSMIETTIRLRDRGSWPEIHVSRWYSGWAPPWVASMLRVAWPDQRARTHDELVDELDRATKLPGWTNAWTAPTRARIDMLSTGIRTPVGVRVTAATPERIGAVASEVRAVLSQLPGVRSVTLESNGEEPRLAFVVDEARVEAFGVDRERAREMARTFASGGQIATMLVDGESLRVRVRPSAGEMSRTMEDLLRELTVSPRGGGPPVPLGLLGRTSTGGEVAMQRSERGELVGYVLVDLREGTDIEAFVKSGARALAAAASKGALGLGPAERTDWIGQYVLMAAGAQRLRWILPLVALSMFLLLYLQFRSVVEALIVLSAVPFALVGSVWALTLAGYPLSAPVWVGLLSVLGLAMQTGVVMVVYIDDAFYRRVAAGTLRSREDIVLAHAEGTIARLRPKLMTIGTMAAGLLPLAFSEGAGAEIMRRVAVPMLGGLVTSAFLTLEVLPVLYTLWRERQLARALRLGVPLTEVAGSAPAWVTAR